jgi:hypothetical protein
MLVWDLMRGMVLFEALLVLVMTALVLRRAFVEARMIGESVPAFFWQISAGVALVTLVVAEVTVERIGKEPVVYGSPIANVGFWLLLFGLWEMRRWQNQMYKSREGRRGPPARLVPSVSPPIITLFFVMFAGMVVLAYQTSKITSENCGENKAQNEVLRHARPPTDPLARASFERAIEKLQSVKHDCPEAL